ncbi:MAG: amidohydrolase [Gammaproteobacteria bacterium]|nr:amidohydrolase [Gammaproteobacteria bacterium]MBV9695522.1 amidohydrolase [Gammaproteobacteria bacterium]
MSTLRVTLVQQPLAWHDAAANREHFARQLAPLAGSTDLIVLPETFTTGFSMDVAALAESAGGPSVEWLQRQAARLDAAVTGSIITVSGGHYFNRLLWVEPDGTVRHYDKRHLFRMAREHEHFTPGRAALIVRWRGLSVCPLVCYDLRFPVFSRRRAELDYDLLLYVANWPAARADAWEALLRARAIENQAYVVGVNRTGTDGLKIPYRGGSAVLDFLGRPLLQLGEAPLVATAVCDTEPLAAFRAKFPAHLDADRFTLAEDA